jgi:YafQ family addiction module toxin component
MPKNRSSWTILARDMVWKMYKLSVKESLDRKLKKLRKRDRELLLSIDKKVKEILKDPYRFKPLKKPMQNKRRVHAGGPFVLIYEVNEEEKIVTLVDFDHHDKIYMS